jgi:UDP-N-acetylmuramoyl-tripeptide--D-alanyl-D-alanine ligase
VELGRHARRIAVLGDMKELGTEGPSLHRGIAEAVEANGIDLLFAAGPLMENLVEALPKSRVAAHTPGSEDLIEIVCGAVQPGDAVMVKGSLSTKMGLIVKALKERYGAAPGAQALKG